MISFANLLMSLGVMMLSYGLYDDVQFADALVVGLLFYIGLGIGDIARGIRKLREK